MTIHIVCPHCNAVNKTLQERLQDQPKCGACHQPLFEKKVFDIAYDQLIKQIQRTEIPLVVDFWAPWCAPCKMMAPAFEQACQQLEPKYRLFKINTENFPQAGQSFGIRGIPTLVMFYKTKEVARISGAMQLPDLLNWIQTYHSK